MMIECRWRDTALDVIPCEARIAADTREQLLKLYGEHLVRDHRYRGVFDIRFPQEERLPDGPEGAEGSRQNRPG
jgi:hypothetical protein